MVTKGEICVCAVKSQGLIAFVNHGLACCKELIPCGGNGDSAVIEDILVVEHAAYLRLLCYTGKESCPLCCNFIEACIAGCVIVSCLSHICKVIAVIFVVLCDSGIVIFEDINLLIGFQSCLDDGVDVTALPLDINGCACLLLESICCFLDYLALRLCGVPHRPHCQCNAAVICCSAFCCRFSSCG